MWLIVSWILPAAAQVAPCGNPWLGEVPAPAHGPVLPVPPGVAKEHRDTNPHGYPNTHVSDRFVIKWGNTGGVSQASAERLAGYFELAWQVTIEEMDHPPPASTAQYLFNVYIGDTGDGTPDGYNTGGYYTLDGEGYPMIVIPRNTLNNRDWAEAVAVHEFYHAVQGEADRYFYGQSSPGAWLFEATANWAAAQALPNSDYPLVFLPAYAYHPHVRVNFFDYPDTGDFIEQYQYGAFIFPVYLSEQVTDWQLIRDVWLDPSDEDDPLVVMDTLLAEQGVAFEEAWLDHCAANVDWAYDHADLYEHVLDWYGRVPEKENLVVSTQALDATWRSPPDELRPQRFGSNTIDFIDAQAGTVTIEVLGDARGSYSSQAFFGARLLHDDEVIPLDFDGNTGSVTIEKDGNDLLKLVVAVWSDQLVPDEVFSYQTRGVVEVPETPVEEGVDARAPEKEKAGCGCATKPGGWSWGWLLLLGVVLRRSSKTP